MKNGDASIGIRVKRNEGKLGIIDKEVHKDFVGAGNCDGIFRYILPYFEGKRVLDVGCAEGGYTKHFSNNSIGIDLEFESLKIAQSNGLNVCSVDINTSLPFRDASFDAIFCSHVLEHVYSPYYLLKEFNRVLKEDGIIVVVVPTEVSLVRLLCDHYFKGHKGHLYAYSVSCLTQLMHRTGFKVIKTLVDVPLTKYNRALWLISDLFQLFPPSLVLWISNGFGLLEKSRKKGDISIH